MRYLLLLLVLTSCYTQKKAEQQVNKAEDHYPEMVANKTRNWFPCITTSVDSSEYNEAERKRDSAMKALGSLEITAGNLKKIIESGKLDLAAKRNCEDILQRCYIYADTLERQNNRLKTFIKNIKDAKPLPPIIRYKKDSADVFIADQRAAKAITEAADWKAKYNAENTLRKEYEKRMRGKVLVPWWVFVIIFLGLVFYFRSSIKTIFMKSIIPAFLLFAMTGCTNFKGTHQWVFSEGLWIIPLILLGGAVKFGIDTYRIRKHGSYRIGPNGNITGQEGGKVRIWEVGRFYFFLGCVAGFLYMVINAIANR